MHAGIHKEITQVCMHTYTHAYMHAYGPDGPVIQAYTQTQTHTHIHTVRQTYRGQTYRGRHTYTHT